MIRIPSNSRRSRLGALALAATAVLVLAACQKKETGAAQVAAQVAAKVNGDEITVHQVEFAMRQQRSLRGEPSEAASRMTLDRLIDQQLEAQKAEAMKLDRDPQVVQALEAVRREILARKYLETIAEQAGKPSEADVKNYYDAHASQFAERKSYTFQRVDIQAPPERRSEVIDKAQSAKTGAELTDWLKAQKLKFSTNPMTAESDRLPPALMEKISKLKEGQSIALPVGVGVAALTLQSSQPAPKSLEAARPQIEQQLAAETRSNTMRNAAKDLRKDAKIEYKGKFAPGAASAPSSPSAGASRAAAPVADGASTAASAPASGASK
jgi:EpsD family peptidyl-prolyl cis-trans isomerase